MRRAEAEVRTGEAVAVWTDERDGDRSGLHLTEEVFPDTNVRITTCHSSIRSGRCAFGSSPHLAFERLRGTQLESNQLLVKFQYALRY